MVCQAEVLAYLGFAVFSYFGPSNPTEVTKFIQLHLLLLHQFGNIAESLMHPVKSAGFWQNLFWYFCHD